MYYKIISKLKKKSPNEVKLNSYLWHNKEKIVIIISSIKESQCLKMDKLNKNSKNVIKKEVNNTILVIYFI